MGVTTHTHRQLQESSAQEKSSSIQLYLYSISYNQERALRKPRTSNSGKEKLPLTERNLEQDSCCWPAGRRRRRRGDTGTCVEGSLQRYTRPWLRPCTKGRDSYNLNKSLSNNSDVGLVAQWNDGSPRVKDSLNYQWCDMSGITCKFNKKHTAYCSFFPFPSTKS